MKTSCQATAADTCIVGTGFQSTRGLKSWRQHQTKHRQAPNKRLIATSHNIQGVEWLEDFGEEIAWIQGDPIQEISNQLQQKKRRGNTASELHIVAHGSEGEIQLGDTHLTEEYLKQSDNLLQSWHVNAIYLWCCEAGLNQKLITALHKYTGANVYSSKTKISRNQPNIYSKGNQTTSLKELIDLKTLSHWEGSLLAAPFLGKAASSYEEITISVNTISSYLTSPPPGLTVSAQTLVDDGAGNISLSAASSSHISIVNAIGVKGFGVTGSIASGDTRELGYHNPSGLSEKITLEFDEIVPEIGFATSWLADSEGDGIYKMYRDDVLVKTGSVDGETDQIDPDVTLSSDDGYGFNKIEFTADGWQNDYLIHKIIYDAPRASNASTASVDELDDASSQDIASQTGSLTVSDADNAGTITASLVGDPIVTLNGSSYTLATSANALTADGAMSLSPMSQTWAGSWSPITWTYNPASADLDFIPAGQDLVIDYGVQLSDGANDSNTVRVEITIVGENDAPSISDATYTLDENTASETIFHDTDDNSTGNDTDIESETISYSITAGNPDGIFAINSSTGEISIATGQSLNYNTNSQHILTVEASDSAESDTANITVNVNLVRPTIILSSGVDTLKAGETDTITFTLSESSTDFDVSDITVNGGTLSDFSGSGTDYTATFTPATDSTTDGVIHVANDKFSNSSGNNNQDENEPNNTVTLTVDTVRPEIELSSDVSTLKAGETAAITFTLTESSTDFVFSDIDVTGGTLSNFAGSGTDYTATFTPATDSTTNGVIHVDSDKFSDAAGNNNQDGTDTNNKVTLTVDTTTTTPTSTPSSSSPAPATSSESSDSPSPAPTSENGNDVYLLLDTSTSMLHSTGKEHSKYQFLVALDAFSKNVERAGYQFKRRDTNATLTSTQLLKTLADQNTTQAIQELDNYTIIDNLTDSKKAGDLNIHLIPYNYHVQHRTFTLARANPNSGIETMKAILSLKMAGEGFGNSIDNNSAWTELGLPDPNDYDLYQGSPDEPSNLYSGTELMGALEGLDYLLTNKANDPIRRNQDSTIALVLDGRPERRSWWDTRTNSASDSLTGQAIPLPKSLGREDITTSGLLYNTEGKPHFFKNNQGEWQWNEMQSDLNAALNLLANHSTIKVNAYGLNNTGSTTINTTYQDLFSNQTFDNSSSTWDYSHQIIQSLQDINL